MLGGFGVIRVPLLFLVATSFCLVSTLLFRVVNQFYFVSDAKRLLPLVGYASVTAIGGYTITTAFYIAAVIFYGVTDDIKLPGPVIFCLVFIAVTVLCAKYTLFTVRLHAAFQDSVYVLEQNELYTLLFGLSLTFVSGIISFLLWRRHQRNDHPQKISSAIFLLLGAFSHLSISMYFVWIFVGRLRKLLNQSTSLKTTSDTGRIIHATTKVQEVIRHHTSLSENEIEAGQSNLSVQSGAESPSGSTLQVITNTALQLAANSSSRFSVNLKPASTEEKAVKTVIKSSEIEDKTMIVVMVRYTLLKIVAVTSSLITLAASAAIILVSVDNEGVDIHETEIFIIFGAIDACVNVLCLFFTFYSFGFSIFKYELCCGCAESTLMHCFENKLKNDFFEQLLREAQKTLKDQSTLQYARTMSFRDVTDCSIQQSKPPIKSRKGLMRSITPSASKSGISLALI